MNIRDLEPKALWNHFADLNAVPRASKKEQQVIAFIVDFGKSLNLPTTVDATGNVIIKKPGCLGMEDRTAVALQSHLDMVHQKNASTQFNFDTDGIQMHVDGDWVKAEGTTLGADNGIGVASIMALLASKDIPHPPLEALFTIDEETGMTGAFGLEGGLLDAKTMLNLDTEDDNELTIGCAGGVDVSSTGAYDVEEIPTGMLAKKISISGLTGGHSGMDIHLGRGNANKLMARILLGAENLGLRIAKFDGGGLRNAIPREAFAEIWIPTSQETAFSDYVDGIRETLKAEYHVTDPDIKISLETTDADRNAMGVEAQRNLLRVIQTVHNGIFRMSPEIAGLVQTSNNLARILIANGKYEILCLTRGSVNSEKDYLANIISSGLQLLGGQVTQTGSYPGWTPNPNASIVKLMSELYKKRFGSEAHVNACHAGLECGILGTHYPEMEMISFGPNIRGAHSPDERVQISSVQKFWGYLLETLTLV